MKSESPGEVGANILYNLHCERSVLKSIIKKLSSKINVKNIKTQLSLVRMWILVRQDRLVHVRTIVAATCIKI